MCAAVSVAVSPLYVMLKDRILDASSVKLPVPVPGDDVPSWGPVMIALYVWAPATPAMTSSAAAERAMALRMCYLRCRPRRMKTRARHAAPRRIKAGVAPYVTRGKRAGTRDRCGKPLPPQIPRSRCSGNPLVVHGLEDRTEEEGVEE